MAKYSSKPATLGMPVDVVYGRVSRLSGLQEKLDQLPQDQLAKIGEVKFDDDSVTINAPQVGEIRFDVIERQEPNKVVFAAANMPVPLKLAVDLAEETPESTRIVSTIDVDIPAMLRPLVGGKMQEAADRFTDLIHQLNG